MNADSTKTKDYHGQRNRNNQHMHTYVHSPIGDLSSIFSKSIWLIEHVSSERDIDQYNKFTARSLCTDIWIQSYISVNKIVLLLYLLKPSRLWVHLSGPHNNRKHTLLKRISTEKWWCFRQLCLRSMTRLLWMNIYSFSSQTSIKA